MTIKKIPCGDVLDATVLNNNFNELDKKVGSLNNEMEIELSASKTIVNNAIKNFLGFSYDETDKKFVSTGSTLTDGEINAFLDGKTIMQKLIDMSSLYKRPYVKTISVKASVLEGDNRITEDTLRKGETKSDNSNLIEEWHNLLQCHCKNHPRVFGDENKSWKLTTEKNGNGVRTIKRGNYSYIKKEYYDVTDTTSNELGIVYKKITINIPTCIKSTEGNTTTFRIPLKVELPTENNKSIISNLVFKSCTITPKNRAITSGTFGSQAIACVNIDTTENAIYLDITLTGFTQGYADIVLTIGGV